MTQKQILSILTPWLQAYLQLHDNFSRWEKLSPVEDLETSPLWKGYYGLFDLYTAEIAARLGVHVHWLSWFIYDNDAGARRYSATTNSKIHPPRPIQNLRDLAQLLAQMMPPKA